MFTRRQILKALIAATNVLIALMLAVPVFGYLLTPLLRKTGVADWVALGPARTSAGRNPNASTSATSQAGYTAESVRGYAYVVAGTDATPLVLSPICTHMGCNVVWNGDRQRFLCPCHGGQFLADGRNVAGPPPRPLDRIPARVENGVLMIQPGKES